MTGDRRGDGGDVAKGRVAMEGVFVPSNNGSKAGKGGSPSAGGASAAVLSSISTATLS